MNCIALQDTVAILFQFIRRHKMVCQQSAEYKETVDATTW